MQHFPLMSSLLSIPALGNIISNLADPIAVKTQCFHPTNTNSDPAGLGTPPWKDLSLANGYPSLLLFFSVLQKLNLIPDGEAIIHRYVLKIKDTIESQGISDLSMFSGVAGICFALQHACFEGTRYQKMVHALNTFLLEKMENTYFTPLRENQRQKLPSSSQLYDPIQGICGIGRYALGNLSIPTFLALTEEIIHSLVLLTQPLVYEGQNVPGWILTPQDPTNGRNRPESFKGNFNLGLAHGVTGVLAFLSIASLHGIHVTGQQEAIAILADWICQQSFLNEEKIAWPYTIPLEGNNKDNNLRLERAKDAWCYGTPGIARTLFLAGKATENKTLKQFAATAFRDVFKRTPLEWQLPGPNLCHGISGLLLITCEMAKEENSSDLLPRIDELKNLLLSFYRSDAPWGFKDVESCRFDKSCEIDKPGFLVGASGVLLTLLSLSSPTPNWHAPLLIHV